MPSHRKFQKGQTEEKSRTERVTSSEEPRYSLAESGNFEKSAWVSRKSFRLRSDVDDDIHDFLETFTHRSWETYHVSPLYGFEDTELRLKQYGLKLLTFLAMMDIIELSVQYEACFKSVGNFDGNKDNKIVKVQVQISKEEDVKETIYLGFIMSLNGSQMNLGEFLYLPILLCTGRMVVKEQVHSALQKFFDCCITPYRFPRIDLVWFTGLFLSLSECGGNQKRTVKFTLRPSWKAETTHHWELLLPLSDIKEIWKTIHPEHNAVITAEEVRIFYDGLIKSVSETAGIKFNMYTINCIKFPDVTVKASGGFLCKSTEILKQLLFFLCSDQSCPDVSRPNLEETE